MRHSISFRTRAGRSWQLNIARAGAMSAFSLVAIWSWLSVGTVIGRFAGSAIPDPNALGLGFLATAVLVSLLAEMWQGRSSLLP
jgi:predicted branched-subunit amino acid permease